MSSPGSEENKRKNWLPPIWRAKPAPPPADPPITKYVSLPERVSAAHLAEITGREVSVVIQELYRLGVFLGVHRGVDFEGAAKFLRKYGIGATKSE